MYFFLAVSDTWNAFRLLRRTSPALRRNVEQRSNKETDSVPDHASSYYEGEGVHSYHTYEEGDCVATPVSVWLTPFLQDEIDKFKGRKNKNSNPSPLLPAPGASSAVRAA